jgi:hypothetical protein
MPFKEVVRVRQEYTDGFGRSGLVTIVEIDDKLYGLLETYEKLLGIGTDVMNKLDKSE